MRAVGVYTLQAAFSVKSGLSTMYVYVFYSGRIADGIDLDTLLLITWRVMERVVGVGREVAAIVSSRTESPYEYALIVVEYVSLHDDARSVSQRV